MNNNINLEYQEHWTELEKTLKELTEEKINMVSNKNTKQWFKESCKKAVQGRDKAISLVTVESSEENKSQSRNNKR